MYIALNPVVHNVSLFGSFPSHSVICTFQQCTELIVLCSHKSKYSRLSAFKGFSRDFVLFSLFSQA